MYDQILALKNIDDKQKRGYLFEQIIREILPWSFKPPIAATTSSEQIDAYFEWNSWHFLVEAKAKEKLITEGSHDWEDFELKIRKRKGFVFGLFLSLGNLSGNILQSAKVLNREGFCIIILHSNVWDDLMKNPIPFEDLLGYMVYHVRLSFNPSPKSIKEIKEWIYDRNSTEKEIYTLSRSHSATFLRRNKHPWHSDIYVPRTIDEYCTTIAQDLKPSKLINNQKIKTKDDLEYQVYRQKPIQKILIRDMSGSGKTTFSVQSSLEKNNYIGIGRAALEENIDEFSKFLSNIGKDYGLHKIIAINKPLVFVVDSLDEATKIPNKHKEIISLLRFQDDLDKIAIRNNLVAFPLLLVFTIREDYWRDWESVFEGSGAKSLTNKFTMFTPSELELAIKKYSNIYNYSINNTLAQETKRTLSIPFNMQVFSEAHQYGGPLQIFEFYEEDVLYHYFAKKRDEILKRRILSFSSKELMCTCSNLAYQCVVQKENKLQRRQVLEAILQSNPQSKMDANEIAHSLKSERIIDYEPNNPNIFRFRHSRFLEYLIAYYILLDVTNCYSIENLEELTEIIFESSFVSMFRVHNYIRHCSKKEFPETVNFLDNFYSKSSRFMRANVLRLRSNIAAGHRSDSSDINLIIKHTEASDPDVVWDSFFVIAAKNNKQSKKSILDFFEIAWENNPTRIDKWKMLTKLSVHNLLMNDRVFNVILKSESVKEWQVFLGEVIQLNQLDEFIELWNALIDEKKVLFFENSKDNECLIVRNLLNIILNKKTFVLGSIQ